VTAPPSVRLPAACLLAPPPAPEPGQLVRVRTRLWVVQDALPHETDGGEVVTRLDLECLDDDRLGEGLSVLWEREVNQQILEADAIPTPSGKWDSPRVYAAFLKAIRWSSTSVLRGASLLSPFRGAIELETYQLEAASRAVVMPRVNLLIADDVGLGKTIEAGLVLQELLARGRVRNCLIVCPASLQLQWRDEMAEKFNLEFRLIDRDQVLLLRREYGSHVNPWRSFPRLITSMDYLKRDAVMAQFESTLDGGKDLLTSWDLLIVDEVHNCAPAGRHRYVRDSDRTRMLRRIAPQFQHRLFLTATPHNGYTESFTALLEELDPLRFQRGPEVDPARVQAVMIRRLKEELAEAEEAHRPFAKRQVRALEVPEHPGEERAYTLLDRYVTHRAQRARGALEYQPVHFALTLLRKRFLSSPLAFSRSLETHLEHVTRPGAAPLPAEALDGRFVSQLILRTQEDMDDDERKDAFEQQALEESSRFFGALTASRTAFPRLPASRT
jgi:SNF2-related domain